MDTGSMFVLFPGIGQMSLAIDKSRAYLCNSLSFSGFPVLAIAQSFCCPGQQPQRHICISFLSPTPDHPVSKSQQFFLYNFSDTFLSLFPLYLLARFFQQPLNWSLWSLTPTWSSSLIPAPDSPSYSTALNHLMVLKSSMTPPLSLAYHSRLCRWRDHKVL